MTRPLQITLWCLASSGWAQSTNYHTNRVFNKVTFTIPGVPTAFQVCDMAGKLTTVVGPTNVVTNSYFATERQSVVVEYGSDTQAWAAAAGAYPSNAIVHSNSFYDNVGWVKGVSQAQDGTWGAYIWLLQDTVNFQTSPTNVWVSTNGVTNAISKVLVGSIGDYQPMTAWSDTGPGVAEGLTNWPTGGSSNDMILTNNFTAYYDIGLPALWIQPMLTNVCVNFGSVNFTLVTNNYVTNVNWSITPTGGVTLAGYATNAVVTVGSVATSYVVKVTANNDTNVFAYAVLNVVMAGSPLQYNIGTNGWADMPDPLYVGSNTTVSFKALTVPAGAVWPGGKPVWGGLLSGSGVETNSYTFSVVSSSTTDYQIVTAECGNTVTGKVIVIKVEFNSLLAAPYMGNTNTLFEDNVASAPVFTEGLADVMPTNYNSIIELRMINNIKTLRQYTKTTNEMYQTTTDGNYVYDGDATYSTETRSGGMKYIQGRDDPAQSYCPDSSFEHPLHVEEDHKMLMQYKINTPSLQTDWKTIGTVIWNWAADVYTTNGVTTSGQINGGSGGASEENPVMTPAITNIPETQI